MGFIDDGKLDSFMFRLFDSNNDGHIDFKEFWMAMYVMTKGTKEQKLKQVNHLNIERPKKFLLHFSRYFNFTTSTMIKKCPKMN